ncbi:MAG: hypothetical protein WBN74_15580, partial [Candidatus Sulfotelmatobacter sp.]
FLIDCLSFMRKLSILTLVSVSLLLLTSCSPRDYLTRRLAADLIATSDTFRIQQQFQLRLGVVANKDYLSPDYLALQHRGWISATNSPCPPALAPPPCWDVTLTPSGVDTFQSLIAPGDAEKQFLTIRAARRELVAITGIAKQDTTADVEFTWRWIPLNEVGAVFYSSDAHYRSTVGFRRYDDGWRVVQGASHPGQSLDEALKNSEPAQ